MTHQRGDCVSCAKASSCEETNVNRFLQNYTCFFYMPVLEGVYKARMKMMVLFGEQAAAKAVLNEGKPEEHHGA